MQLLLDTADAEVVRALSGTGFVDGVTTTSELLAAVGGDPRAVVAELCQLVEGPVCVEATAADRRRMVGEGEQLSELGPNVVVTLPVDWEGLSATRELTSRGIQVNVGPCLGASQALLAAKAAASFVSVPVGDVEDRGGDSAALIQAIRDLFQINGFGTRIVATSLRRPEQAPAGAVAGAHVASVSPTLFEQLLQPA